MNPRLLARMTGLFFLLTRLTFLYPPLGYKAFPIAALIGLLGAAAMIFWLLIFGVNEGRWKALAERATA